MSTQRPVRPAPRPPGGRPARGPLPRSVYRRRRLMVGGTLIALVLATVNLFHGGDAPTGDVAQQVAGSPRSAAPTDGVTTGPRKGGKGGKGQGKNTQPVTPPEPTYTPPPEPPPAEPEGRCDDSDIMVTPVMAEAVAGRPVLVTLELRTREAVACTWSVSRESLAYKITDSGSGDADVWSSSQCPAQVPTDDVVVRRDLTTTYRLAWNGRASSVDCPSMKHVDPGEYAVQAAAIGGEPSEVVPFVLIDPADVVPEQPVGPPVPETTDPPKSKGKGKNQGKNKPA